MNGQLWQGLHPVQKPQNLKEKLNFCAEYSVYVQRSLSHVQVSSVCLSDLLKVYQTHHTIEQCLRCTKYDIRSSRLILLNKEKKKQQKTKQKQTTLAREGGGGGEGVGVERKEERDRKKQQKKQKGGGGGVGRQKERMNSLQRQNETAKVAVGFQLFAYMSLTIVQPVCSAEDATAQGVALHLLISISGTWPRLRCSRHSWG